jgi:hypothetical protein
MVKGVKKFPSRLCFLPASREQEEEVKDQNDEYIQSNGLFH